MIVQWPGIPETYWPNTDTPWRVSWGFGAFEDFATNEEAQAFFDKQVEEQKNGWQDLVVEPYKVVEDHLLRDCPKCGSGVGEGCIDLRKTATGTRRTLLYRKKTPHSARA